MRYANVSLLIADLRRALMTPDEDFVKIAPVVSSNDPTRVMSNEEVEQIKNEANAAAAAVPLVVTGTRPPCARENNDNRLVAISVTRAALRLRCNFFL